MAYLNYHPSPGFGDLLPGFFVVPQNPIMDGGTELVPSVQAKAMGRTVRIPHVGDLLPGQFPVPQNPILAVMANGMGDLSPGKFPVPQNPISMAGLGCGCGGGCNGSGYVSGSGLQGLGDFLSDPVATWIQADSPIPGISNLTFWAVTLAGGWFILTTEVFKRHRK